MSRGMAVILPERVGGRAEAQEFVQRWEETHPGVRGKRVVIQGRHLQWNGSSYIDELVTQFLLVLGAKRLIFRTVPDQAAFDANASAKTRGVAGRVTVHTRR